MKIQNLIKVLQDIEKKAKKKGTKVEDIDVFVEATGDDGHIYYENNIRVHADINDKEVAICLIK